MALPETFVMLQEARECTTNLDYFFFSWGDGSGGVMGAGHAKILAFLSKLFYE